MRGVGGGGWGIGRRERGIGARAVKEDTGMVKGTVSEGKERETERARAKDSLEKGALGKDGDIVVETITKGVEAGGEVSDEVQNLYGVIPRAIFDIFNEINRMIEAHGAQVELKINYYEIYMEIFNDLLSPNPNMGKNLKLREMKNG